MASLQLRRPLYLELRPALIRGRQNYRSGRSFRISDLIDALGPASSPVVAFVLAAPFIWPFSLGPLTVPASVLIALIGVSLLRGAVSFPVPAKFLAVPLPEAVFRILRRVVALIVRRIGFRHLGSPEADALAPNEVRRLAAIGLISGAALLAIPIPLLPLTNTCPAIALMLFSAAYVGANPKRLVLGAFFSALSVVVFLIVGIAALKAGGLLTGLLG